MTFGLNDTSRPLFIVNTIFGVLALTATVGRCYVRGYMTRSFGLDDGLMVTALVFFMGIVVTIEVGCFIGLGVAKADLRPGILRLGHILWWYSYAMYGFSITLARLSVALLFLRLTIAKYYRWFLYKSIFINTCSGIAFVCVAIFRCTPVDYFWKQFEPGASGTCVINGKIMGKLGFLYGTMCIVTDVGYLLYPLFLFWTVSMDRRTKIALMFVLALSGTAASGPFVRMFYMHELWSPELLRDGTDVLLWTVVETGLAISASSLATLRPLLHAVSTKGDRSSLVQHPNADGNPSPSPKSPQTPNTMPSIRHWQRGIRHLIRTITVTHAPGDEDVERDGRGGSGMLISLHADSMVGSRARSIHGKESVETETVQRSSASRSLSATSLTSGSQAPVLPFLDLDSSFEEKVIRSRENTL